MQVYRLECGTDPHTYHPTRDAAHDAAKRSGYLSSSIFIDLIDVQVDKDGVVSLMNGEPKLIKLRTWALTHRKGLKEITGVE